jgi:hypothetical protein
MIFNIISMSHKTENCGIYPFEKKQKLADRISVMRDKPTLRKIRDIIKTENPESTSRKNSNGYLMYFQSYSDITYIKIEKLLNKIEKDKLEQQTKSITEMSDNMMMSSDDPNTDYTLSRTRLRYSNREKRLIKRQQYEDVIHEQYIDSENELNTKAKRINTTKPLNNNLLQENSKTTRIVSNKKPTETKSQQAPNIFSKNNK